MGREIPAGDGFLASTYEHLTENWNEQEKAIFKRLSLVASVSIATIWLVVWAVTGSIPGDYIAPFYIPRIVLDLLFGPIIGLIGIYYTRMYDKGNFWLPAFLGAVVAFMSLALVVIITEMPLLSIFVAMLLSSSFVLYVHHEDDDHTVGAAFGVTFLFALLFGVGSIVPVAVISGVAFVLVPGLVRLKKWTFAEEKKNKEE